MDVGLVRRAKGEEFNRMDAQSIEFYRRVEAGYGALVLAEPERWCVVDATQSIDVVTERYAANGVFQVVRLCRA